MVSLRSLGAIATFDKLVLQNSWMQTDMHKIFIFVYGVYR